MVQHVIHLLLTQHVLVILKLEIPVISKGNIQIFNSIVLNSVIHVPNLSYNLISINKLMKLMKGAHCFAKFSTSHCIFQDLSSKKLIYSVKDCGRLYYFDDANVSKYHQITS